MDKTVKRETAERDGRPRLELVRAVVETEDDATELATLIRPLPHNVVPSPGFMAQLRGQFLALSARHPGASGRAA